MARFSYIAQNENGETASGVLDAAGENEAIQALQAKGYFILSLQAEAARSLASISLGGGTKVAQRDLAFWGEQLATLLNGGVPLVRALTLLAEHSESRGLRLAVSGITKDVAAGSALYKALEKHPNVFDPLWISLVQAGEMGGQLPKALKQVAAYVHAAEDLKGKVMTALMYPAILGTISLGVLFFFIIKIIPTFADIFKTFGLKLPALTALVIGVSNGFVHHLFAIIAAVAGTSVALRLYLATEDGQVAKAQFLFSLPFFGRFFKNILTERLLTTLSTLIESGVSILNAINVLEGVFSNNILFVRALKDVKNDVASGKSISASFKKAQVFPPLVTEMMWMGEESGKLAEILSTLSGFYREQIEQFVRRFTSIIDPIMVVFIGGIVGVIVISIFLPIFQLSQIGTHG